jgi:hypothetical protein
MTTLTDNLRLEAYTWVLHDICTADENTGLTICPRLKKWLIQKHVPLELLPFSNVLEIFPEFADQRPSSKKVDDTWWPIDELGPRINALVQAIIRVKIKIAPRIFRPNMGMYTNDTQVFDSWKYNPLYNPRKVTGEDDAVYAELKKSYEETKENWNRSCEENRVLQAESKKIKANLEWHSMMYNKMLDQNTRLEKLVEAQRTELDKKDESGHWEKEYKLARNLYNAQVEKTNVLKATLTTLLKVNSDAQVQVNKAVERYNISTNAGTQRLGDSTPDGTHRY